MTILRPRMPWRPLTAALLGSLCLAGTPARAQTLDLTKPDDAVKVGRRLQCSMEDGKPTIFSWHGSVYSRVAGERDRLLFNVEGMNIRACKTVTDPARGYGFRLVSRELLLYLDPEKNTVLTQWNNPFTGKAVEVVHVANDPVNQPPMFARSAKGEPATFSGTVMNGRIWQSIEVPLFYRNPLGGDFQDYVGGMYQAMEMFDFFADERDLLDASHDPTTETVSWSRVSNWLPWMEMGDRPGILIFSTVGKRLNNPASLPALMQAEIKANYPAYSAPPPLDDTRPNETSWTYFKKMIDKKKAKPGPAGQ